MSQLQRPHRVSRIEVQSPQGDVQEGKRLMIIKLERYNKIGEPLIENSVKNGFSDLTKVKIGWDQ